ncbi:hypothetical protein ACGTN6_18845 [Halomonas sp. THAF12]|uniref:hypothetical protein n=1 Tax=Halomonas sp. B23F22_10 TaxID=3459515 RepID=UPI00373EDC9D
MRNPRERQARYHDTDTTQIETLRRQVIRHRDWVHGRQALRVQAAFFRRTQAASTA